MFSLLRNSSIALLLSINLCLAQSIGPSPSSSGSPSGAAGGDLGGTYPNPTVTNGSHITNSSILNSGLATPAPCSAFGTTSGTCLQGGAGNVPNNSLVTPPTAVGTAAVGQIPGTTTNDSASAGNIGELFVAGSEPNATPSSTVTITIANPAVVSWTGNPFFYSGATNSGCGGAVSFSTSGALPTGITAATIYYVTCNAALTANAFNISTSIANAIAGTTVTTSGTQSGTQTGSAVVAISTNSPIDYAAMALTAGDWDVNGTLYFSPANTTAITKETGGVFSSTGEGGTTYSYYQAGFASEVAGGITSYIPTNAGRISLSGTTTVFCSIAVNFTISTMQAGGKCRARRVR